jgi:hypothetical protein
MNAAARPVRPPERLLGVAFGVVAVTGVALVAAPGTGSADAGLSPRTVARHLAAAAPRGARDVRISGVYGSGHRGTWQFTGFLTWRDPNGMIQGGSTELPQHGGQPAIDLNFTAERLASEHALGLTASGIRQVLSGVGRVDAELAMVELAITADGMTAVSCTAASTETDAACAEYDATGRARRRFGDRLFEAQGLDAVSVQRESAPITGGF